MQVSMGLVVLHLQTLILMINTKFLLHHNKEAQRDYLSIFYSSIPISNRALPDPSSKPIHQILESTHNNKTRLRKPFAFQRSNLCIIHPSIHPSIYPGCIMKSGQRYHNIALSLQKYDKILLNRISTSVSKIFYKIRKPITHIRAI